MTLQTEFEFTLPRGYVDENGNLHNQGTMRLATAMDEIVPLRDLRVKSNQAYLAVILLNRVITKLGSLADGILDGDVTVAPYRLRKFSPCNWCSFRSVCRFEFGQDQVRSFPDLKRQEVFAELSGSGRAGS